MNLGVLGGTFHPIHLAHLRVAEEAREALGLDRVLFMPAKIPPHKEASGVAPAEVRLELVRLAVRDNPGFGVSDLELAREGPSYSVDTLRELRGELGPDDRLWFLMGSDSFREVESWHRYPELFALADVAVLRRPPDVGPLDPPPTLAEAFSPTPEGYRHASGREVRFVPVTLLDVSSTEIRRSLARGRSVRYLVPEALVPRLEALSREHPECFHGVRDG